MITGDNRCLALGPAAVASADLCQSDTMMKASTTTTGGHVESSHGFRLKIRQTSSCGQSNNWNDSLASLPKTIDHEGEQLNRAAANELLKLTDLKLHDDDDDDSDRDTETTTSTSTSRHRRRLHLGRLQAKTVTSETTRTTTIEAPAKLNGSGDAGGQRRMLLVATCSQEQQPASTSTTSGSAAAANAELNQKQLVELDARYATIDYPMHHYEQQQNTVGATNHFVSGPAGSSGYSTLELEANYPAYGSHSDYLIGSQHQPQAALEFLELEPSLDSRVLRLESNNKPLYYHQPAQAAQQNLVNFDSSTASSTHQYPDTTTTITRSSNATSSYLSSGPSPAACNLTYDSDQLPDSVIQFNHHHSNNHHHHHHHHHDHHHQPQRQQHHPFSAIQFAGGGGGAQNQYYTNNDNQQQHQDGCSSLSCVDDNNSGSLAGLNDHHHHHLDAGSQQQQQSSHPGARLQPMTMMQHHHQQINQPYPLVMAGSVAGATATISGQSEPELKVCEWEGCENTFLDMQEFVKHLEDRHVNQKPNEKNRYFCLWSNCKRNEQEFNARYKLLIHMRVHSGEKPYPCNNVNCKKSFSRLENLKIHQRSHTGEKPYKCIFDACSKSFTNSSDRIKHHKTHKDPKPYSCNYEGCSKRYTDPSSLRKHLRAHKRGSQLIGLGATEGAASNCCDLQSSSGGSNSELGPQQPPPGCCSASYDPASLLSSSSGTTFASTIHHDHQHQHQLYSQPSNLTAHNQRAASIQQQTFDQQQQQQHNQLSRSWCAGTTTSNNLGHGHDDRQRPISSHWTHQLTAGSDLGFGQPQQQQHQYKDQQQHQQQQQQSRFQFPAAVQQLRTQHETLMRSLPLAGGFRVPVARLSHAHAHEWPPPQPETMPEGWASQPTSQLGQQQQQHRQYQQP